LDIYNAVCVPIIASCGTISTRLYRVSQNRILIRPSTNFLNFCISNIFRMIGICITMLIVIINEKSQIRKIMEILRLIITSLVYIEFIDGRYWISWIILLSTPLCICYYPTEIKSRMLGIMLGFFCPLTLLSASYEPLFFLTLTINLFCWLQAVPTISKTSRNVMITKDLIKAAIFVSFLKNLINTRISINLHIIYP